MSPASTPDGVLRCARCSYEWVPRKDQPPKRCPRCRSIKWDAPHLRVTCLRCGHTWNSHNGTPKRCPSCGTHQWDTPPRTFNCRRCGYTWNAKGSRMPRRCPLCASREWFNDPAGDTKKPAKQEASPDSAMEGLILREYRKGLSCVDISIAHSLPYSVVYNTIRKNLVNTNIKV